jgi:zinc protease
MRNLVIDPLDVKKEREVVKEERRVRVDNSVRGYLSEAVYRTVFKVHPYRWPIAGSLVDLNAASMDDMRTFYNKYYAPNNAILVIVGDFQSKQAKKLISKYYGPIAPQELPVSSRPLEPEQKATRREVLLKPVQNETFSIAYKGSQASASDYYALDLLSSILADGRSSRLYKRFVYQEQLASSIHAWSYTPKDPGIFQIYVSVKPGQSSRPILRGIYREIAGIRKSGITEKELTKAKNQVMMSFVDGLKTVSGKAQALAASEMVSGSYEQVFKDFANYQQVTLDQVQAVARKYLTPERRSLVLVKPRPSETQSKQKSFTQQRKGA